MCNALQTSEVNNFSTLLLIFVYVRLDTRSVGAGSAPLYIHFYLCLCYCLFSVVYRARREGRNQRIQGSDRGHYRYWTR